MFMKHYAPNRCLYIKVAKLRTGVGSEEMSHLQNCSLKIYLKRALGGGGGGGGGSVRMDVNEELKFLCGGGGLVWGGGGGSGWGGQGRCVQRSEVFVRIEKKNCGGGGGVGSGGGFGSGGGGGFGLWGSGFGLGGSGWM